MNADAIITAGAKLATVEWLLAQVAAGRSLADAQAEIAASAPEARAIVRRATADQTTVLLGQAVAEHVFVALWYLPIPDHELAATMRAVLR